MVGQGNSLVEKVSDRTKKALQSMNLTEYETRVYLVLLEHGHLTASRISELSDVSYSKIYDVLSSLEKKGWIGSEGGRPALYYAKSPATALETMRLMVESEFRKNEEQILSELMPIYEGREVKEKPDIWILRGEFNILAKVKEVISNCERELLVAIPTVPKQVLDEIAPLLINIKTKGGNTLIMTSNETDASTLRRLANVAEIRVREVLFAGGIVSDTREVVILFAEERGTFSLAIWSDHISLAKFAKNYFEFLWKESKEPSLKKKVY